MPRQFADALVQRTGDAGRRWVAGVPALAERLCGQWQIELTGDAALYGDNNLLLPARHATDACLLKLCVPGHDTAAEVTALLAWDGRGAVRLQEASPELSVPELMWTRLDEAGTASDIRALLAAITHAAALDPAKAGAWTIVRAVDYWLWGLDHDFTSDPVRCHRLLDALAR